MSDGIYISSNPTTGGGLIINQNGLSIGPTYDSSGKMITGGLNIDKNGWTAGKTSEQEGLYMGNGRLDFGRDLVISDQGHAGKNDSLSNTGTSTTTTTTTANQRILAIVDSPHPILANSNIRSRAYVDGLKRKFDSKTNPVLYQHLKGVAPL